MVSINNIANASYRKEKADEGGSKQAV